MSWKFFEQLVKRRVRRSVSVTLVALVSSLVFSPLSQGPSSEAQSKSSAVSSSSSSPKKKCCFCITPPKGARNATEFMEYCNTCLMDPKLNAKVASCDIRESVAATDFKGPDPRQCSADVLVYNLEHGPIPGKVFNRIDICVKAMPSCALEFVDLSCKTMEDQREVDQYLATLQKSLGQNTTVTLCGNASSNYPKDKCAKFESARVTYVVSANKIENPPSRCAQSFTACDRADYTQTCLNNRNELKEQVCCAKMAKDLRTGSEYSSGSGVWGEPGEGCSAFPSCPAACSTKKYCSSGGERLFIRECVKIRGGDFACEIDWDNCGTFGKVCDPKLLLCDDPPKPSSSISSSASSSAQLLPSSPQSAQSVNGGGFVELSRADQEYKVSAAWLSMASAPRALFGLSIVVEVSGSLADGGILLHTLDVGSTLGLFRLENGDIIHFVNDTPIRSRGDLVRALSPSQKYLGITYSRGGVRRLVTVRVGLAEGSAQDK